MKQSHWLLCMGKELWLVQANHATVKLDSSFASRGMKTYSEARIELRNCNKLQLIIGRGTHITDMSNLTFNDYRDGGLAKHKIQLKSTMGNVVRDAWLVTKFTILKENGWKDESVFVIRSTQWAEKLGNCLAIIEYCRSWKIPSENLRLQSNWRPFDSCFERKGALVTVEIWC